MKKGFTLIELLVVVLIIAACTKEWFSVFEEEYMVDGDSLYKDDLGRVISPIGTYEIMEEKAPEGKGLKIHAYSLSSSFSMRDSALCST